MVAGTKRSYGIRLLGCGLVFFGSIYCTCLISMLVAGDSVHMALLMAQMTTASSMGVSVIVGLVIWLFAASHASRQRYERRKWLRLIEQIRSGVQQRGQVSDDLACESVPIESRPFFLEVRAAVADFFGCPAACLRGNDSLETDYQSRKVPWWYVENHVIERLVAGPALIHPSRSGQRATATLADFAESLGMRLEAR